MARPDDLDDYKERMAIQFARDEERARETFPVTVMASRQHYLDMLLVWRHCRQIGPLKPAALRMEKLARAIRDQLDKQDVPTLQDELEAVKGRFGR